MRLLSLKPPPPSASPDGPQLVDQRAKRNQMAQPRVGDASASAELRLLSAAAAGELDEVNALLDEGVDVAFQDSEGLSALMKAADGGHGAVVAVLLQAGCPWNLQDHEGYTAGASGRMHAPMHHQGHHPRAPSAFPLSSGQESMACTVQRCWTCCLIGECRRS